MSETGTPPDDPDKPKRLSFREANLGPTHRPEPPLPQMAQGFLVRRKRTVVVTLLAAGAGAAAIYGVAHSRNCESYPPDQVASCRSSGGGSGGHYWGGSSSSGSSSSESSSTSRGGFGFTGSAHASGGE
ncbi:hypothetical protein [Methyloferula stellata]|uniref:hypothetical protein n=1 Tax=Methyloferula stellata TaxID=876270 RepID=UPI00036F25C2|nr:hypothetical protein [Methyloferula stellata]